MTLSPNHDPISPGGAVDQLAAAKQRKSLSSGKASGKTPDHSIHDESYCIECRVQCYPWEPCNCCHLGVEAPLEEELAAKDKRIAELEAELAGLRKREEEIRRGNLSLLQVADAADARAEKAEAEVKRQRIALREAKRAMDNFNPRDCPHMSQKGHYDTKAQKLVNEALGVNPSGDGHLGGASPARVASPPHEFESVTPEGFLCTKCGRQRFQHTAASPAAHNPYCNALYGGVCTCPAARKERSP